MKLSEMRPSKYVKAADLNGKAVTLIMNYVEMKELFGQDEEKPVLFFQNAVKGLVLNVTNSNAIAEEYGDETDDWSEKPIVLYPDKTDFSGKRVDCVRVRIPEPALEPAMAGAEGKLPADDNPF